MWSARSRAAVAPAVCRGAASERERAPGNGWREGTRCVRLLSRLSKMLNGGAYFTTSISTLHTWRLHHLTCISAKRLQSYCVRERRHTRPLHINRHFFRISRPVYSAWAWLGRVVGRPAAPPRSASHVDSGQSVSLRTFSFARVPRVCVCVLGVSVSALSPRLRGPRAHSAPPPAPAGTHTRLFL